MSTTVENALAALEQQLAKLASRLDEMERRISAQPSAARPEAKPEPVKQPAPVKAAPPAPPAAPEVTEEELLAISAALAAYFGVRVHVRQVRLISSAAWAQQGRVSVQASHLLH